MLSAEQTNKLLVAAQNGSDTAVQTLLAEHRHRLRRLVAVRLDRRLSARVDPSDVVQETLWEAVRRLPTYLNTRPLPFYPWLRQLAIDRLARECRTHIEAACRSVSREQVSAWHLNDDSVLDLARQLVTSETGPGSRVMLRDLRDVTRGILESLDPRDREILVMKYLEQLTLREIAVVLKISESAAKSRHVRALHRFALQMDESHRRESDI